MSRSHQIRGKHIDVKKALPKGETPGRGGMGGSARGPGGGMGGGWGSGGRGGNDNWGGNGGGNWGGMYFLSHYIC